MVPATAAGAEGSGPSREFCGGSCRQQEYLRRQRASEAGLAEHELVVTRTELDELHDKLYVLEAAVEDVERDLADTPRRRTTRKRWLAPRGGAAAPAHPPGRPSS